MIVLLSVVTSVKDYVEIVHKLIESNSNGEFNNYVDVGSIITFFLVNGKNLLVDFFTFNWFKQIWSLPIIIPEINSAILSEILILDGNFHNTFNFPDISVIFKENNLGNSALLFGLEKFFIGLLNSVFLILPTATSHAIILRRFVIQGSKAGYIAGAGTICGNILWISSIILGFRFFVIPWLSLDIFRYILGFLILTKYMWDSSTEKKTTENFSVLGGYAKFFFLNLILTLIEQTSLYPFLTNINFGSESTSLEGFSTNTFIEFVYIHGLYLIGLFFGSCSLLHFSCWFWQNPGFYCFQWLSTKVKGKMLSVQGVFVTSKFLNFLFLYLTMICAISSIPYYGLDYTLTKPLGFVSDDRIIDQKMLLETSFLNSKASDRNTRRNRGRHGRRERWKRRVRKYRTFDATLYDTGVYDLFPLEDLNYGFDRFWLRRKMRNHRVRFRFFPGPWMRSFKKQLAKPRLDANTGPRLEFFRILFEQVFHPSFHNYDSLWGRGKGVTTLTAPKITEQVASYGNSQSWGAKPFLSQKTSTQGAPDSPHARLSEKKNLVTLLSPKEPNTTPGKEPKQVGDFTPPHKTYSFFNEIFLVEGGEALNPKTNSNFINKTSIKRKFVRNVNNRIKKSQIGGVPQKAKQHNLIKLPLTYSIGSQPLGQRTKNNATYSKRWKFIFSRMKHNFIGGTPQKIKTRTLNGLDKGILTDFYKNTLKGWNPKKMAQVYKKNSSDSQNMWGHSLKKISQKEQSILNYKSFFLMNGEAADRNLLTASLGAMPPWKKKTKNHGKAWKGLGDATQGASPLPVGGYTQLSVKPQLKLLDNLSREASPPGQGAAKETSVHSQSKFAINTPILFHPLKIFLKKQKNFERKLNYYKPSVFRQFSIENNAPYFRVMMKRYFYFYKPNLRWEQTLKNATMRKARRKTSKKPKKMQHSTFGLIDQSINQSAPNLVLNGGKSTPFQPLIPKVLTQGNRLQKATHNFAIKGKRASRYRYQIYKDVLQHWYYSPFNRLLLKFDVDSFIQRQPRNHFLTKNEENLLHLRRLLLSEHYDTLRWYTLMENYGSMKIKIGGTKSFANKTYNQQFSGTFKKIRHLFSITPSQNFKNVLKFDQPLYNEFKNQETNPVAERPSQNFILHEEVRGKGERNLNLEVGGAPLVQNPQSTLNKKHYPEDLLSQSTKILRIYLLKAKVLRKKYANSLIKEKKFKKLNQFFFKGKKIRGTKSTTNERALYLQEKNMLWNKNPKEESLPLKTINSSLGRPVIQETFLQDLDTIFLKNWKRKVINQEFLKNFLTRHLEKTEKRKNKKEKNLKAKLINLTSSLSSASWKNVLDGSNGSFAAPQQSSQQGGAPQGTMPWTPFNSPITTGSKKAIVDGVESIGKMPQVFRTRTQNWKQHNFLKSKTNLKNLHFISNLKKEKEIISSIKTLSTINRSYLSNYKAPKSINTRLGKNSHGSPLKTVLNRFKTIKSRYTFIKNKVWGVLPKTLGWVLPLPLTPKNWQKKEIAKGKQKRSRKVFFRQGRSAPSKKVDRSKKKLFGGATQKNSILFQGTLGKSTKTLLTSGQGATQGSPWKKNRFPRQSLVSSVIPSKNSDKENSKNEGGQGPYPKSLFLGRKKREEAVVTNLDALTNKANTKFIDETSKKNDSINWTSSPGVRVQPQQELLRRGGPWKKLVGRAAHIMSKNFIWGAMKSPKNFKRKKYPQRRSRNQKGRGVVKKRTLVDSVKLKFKTILNLAERHKQIQNIKSLWGPNVSIGGATQKGHSTTNKKVTQQFNLQEVDLKLQKKKLILYNFIKKNIYKSESLPPGLGATPLWNQHINFADSPNLHMGEGQGQNNNGALRQFKLERFNKGLKQRRSNQKKQRFWKEKRTKFMQKRRKYRKRQLYLIGKIRILSKQMKKLKAKAQLQNWWWEVFLPNLKAETNSLWQLEKDRQIKEKLFMPSLQKSPYGGSPGEFLPTEMITSLYPLVEHPKQNGGAPYFTNQKKLEIGDKDFKPFFQGTLGRAFRPEGLSPKTLNKHGGVPHNVIDNKTVPQKLELGGFALPHKQNNFFIKTNATPFYAGWDNSVRKFIVTNRLLSLRTAGYKMHFIEGLGTNNEMIGSMAKQPPNSMLAIKKMLLGWGPHSKDALASSTPVPVGAVLTTTTFNIPTQNPSLQSINFTDAPLKGMNAATTLYWQIPFTTYDPDQFFALGMDGFSPIGWKKFNFRHTILKSWLYNIVSKKTNVSLAKPESLTKQILKVNRFDKGALEKQGEIPQGLLPYEIPSNELIYKLQIHQNSNKKLNSGNNEMISNTKLRKLGRSANFKTPKYIFRRLKKRYRRVKKHPRSPAWFPSGPLLNQVLPVHYIYVFYKRSRLPRDRYLKRHLKKKGTLEAPHIKVSGGPLSQNESMAERPKQKILGYYANSSIDMTLRKRIKSKRKYHQKQVKNPKKLLIPRRKKFLGPSAWTPKGLHLKTVKGAPLKSPQNALGVAPQNQRWRPLSQKKVSKSVTELIKEQRALKLKQKNKELNSKQSPNFLRMRQLRRRVKRQILKSVWRYKPRAGGFVWPGDYLRLELVKANKLNSGSPLGKFTNEGGLRPYEKVDEASQNKNMYGIATKEKSRKKEQPRKLTQRQKKKKRAKRPNLQEWQPQQKKLLLQKHNIKVLKKKLEKAQLSHTIKERIKELNLRGC